MKSRIERIGYLFPLVLITLFSIFPVYWMVLCSIRSYPELTATPPHLFPVSFSGEFYRTVFLYTSFFTFLKNSCIVTLGTVAVNMVVSAMAAHSLARLRFKGKLLLSRGILFTYVLPKMVILIPIFVTLVRLGLANTYIGLILTYVVFTFPFCVWMLTAYFQTIPKELEECARIDGASNMRAFIQIILPLAAPGIGAVAIFTFISTWKEFLYAFIILNIEAKKTLTVGLYGLLGLEVVEWGESLAMSTLMVIPVLIFFFVFQKGFVRGLTAGAVKG